MNRKKKIVLITGSSKRIGRSIAISLAKKGYDIALHYNKSKKESENLKKEIISFGVRAESFKLNLQNTKLIKPFFEKIRKKFGIVEILINNASTFELDSLKTSTLESYDNHFNVNLKAPFFLSKYFLENLKGKKGNIINILDQRVLNISPYFTTYTISKVALSTMTKSLALSLAPKVRVNGIAPGPTLKSKRQTNNEFDKQILRTPLKKRVSLNEINNGVDFLINNEALTGQILFFDSGQNMGWAHTKSEKFIDD